MFLSCALLLIAAGTAVGRTDLQPKLIPREHFWPSSEREMPKVSPDGARIASIVSDSHLGRRVMVRGLQSEAEVAVSPETKHPRSLTWSEDSTALLIVHAVDGDGNTHVSAVDPVTLSTRDLTPGQGLRGELLATAPALAQQVLVQTNARDRRLMDVWRVDLRTGVSTLDTTNPGDVVQWLADSQLMVRASVSVTKDGGRQLRVRDAPKAPWRPLITTGLKETVTPHAFTLDGKSLYLTTSISGDTGRLVEKNLKTGSERVLASSPSSDVSALWLHPSKRFPVAAAQDLGGKLRWLPLDSSVAADFAAIDIALPGTQWSPVSSDRADGVWVLAVDQDTAPTRHLLWERAPKRVTPLFPSSGTIESQQLAPTGPVSLAARDGLALSGFLTLPRGMSHDGGSPLAPATRSPLVLLVHGGPWTRDTWRYTPLVQLLANRGAAVLQVNFRGSTGSGARIHNAGNKQWGLGMTTDLLDAAQWAVAQGVADPDRIAVMGTSYGGFATLSALAMAPAQFRCGVEAFGLVDLLAHVATAPSGWELFRPEALGRIGDPSNPTEREALRRASPLSSAESVRAPVLVVHGGNDPRVKTADVEKVVATLAGNGVPTTFVVYPDEGHGVSRRENRLDLAARVESFLGTCLNLSVQPLPSEGRVSGSSAEVKTVPVTRPKKN